VISTRSLVPEHLLGVDNRAFLAGAYLELMGRAIDPTGFRDYMARLGDGIDRNQIWEELASSEECRNHALRRSALQPVASPTVVRHVDDLLALERDHFVRAVYRALLGREADPTGLRDYVARLDGGDAKQRIIADICADPEGQAYGARLPGLDLLLAQDALARIDPATAENILRADEARFLPAAAQVILGRQLHPREQVVYDSYLDDGMPKAFVLQRMHDSPDGSGRPVPGLAKVIRRYQQANRSTWRGWYLRNVLGVESDFPLERRVRAIARRGSLPRSVVA
jgi:hypothetical protein